MYGKLVYGLIRRQVELYGFFFYDTDKGSAQIKAVAMGKSI